MQENITNYRRDIDGLRAIAVLAVLFFHFFPRHFEAGFIGVDIFFVISGFLISRYIFEEFSRGQFSYLEFYKRRARRIFPALALVLLCCTFLAWLVLMPTELQAFSRHALAGIAFFSNIFLWSEVGYFDVAAEVKPLLHLWSLGLEEQFYVFWPILIGLIWRFKLPFHFVVIGLGFLFFIYNVALVNGGDRDSAFYLPHSRFWEPMVGCGVAWWLRKNQIHNDKTKNMVSALGVTLIFLALLLIKKNSMFPGAWALLPVCGAALLILAGPEAKINRKILSHHFLVSVGLISYPLYLWHWPLISFATILEGGSLPTYEYRFLFLLCSFLLAWATYKYFELPLRFGFLKKQAISISVGLFGVLSIAFVLVVLNKFQLPFRDHIKPYLSVSNSLFGTAEGWFNCDEAEFDLDSCKVLNKSIPPEIAVVGDSHADHLLYGLLDIFKSRPENLTVKIKYGKLPFLNYQNSTNSSKSKDEIESSLIRLVSAKNIKTIVLSARGVLEAKAKPKSFRATMFKTLETLIQSNKKIVFFVDVPYLNFDPKSCVQMRPIALGGFDKRGSCTFQRAIYEKKSKNYLKIVSAAKHKFPQVTFIYADKFLCDAQVCQVLVNGRLLYNDQSHLTPYGSQYLMGKMRNEFLAAVID